MSLKRGKLYEVLAPGFGAFFDEGSRLNDHRFLHEGDVIVYLGLAKRSDNDCNHVILTQYGMLRRWRGAAIHEWLVELSTDD